MKRSKPRAVSSKHAKELRDAKPIRDAYLREHPDCEARVHALCGGRAGEVHEPDTRARGGRIDDPSNMLALCFACHRWIHEHPALATERGWLQ